MRIRNVLCLGMLAFAGGCNGDNEPLVPGVAHDDAFTINEDAEGLDLRAALDNDDAQVEYLTDVSDPVNGNVFGSYGDYTYRPFAAFHGSEDLTYTAQNGAGGLTTARIHIDVTSDGIGFEESALVDEHGADAEATADLDGDGRIDIVTCDDQSSAITILLNRTTAPFQYTFETARFEGGRTPRAVELSDVDRDGRLDIITASRNDGALVILRNTTAPGGVLSFAAPVQLPSGQPIDLAVVDIDSDGREDLVALDDDRRVLVHMSASTQPGDMTFAPPVALATPWSPQRLVVTDLDRDGRQDLAVLSGDPGTLSLFVNTTPTGTTVPQFAARIDRATANQPKGMAVVDLDGDQQDEIVVLHAYQPMWIYANRGGAGVLQYEAARVVDVGGNSSTIRAMDLDGDGALDLLVGNDSVGYQQLFNRTTGVGSFDLEPASARVNVLEHGANSIGSPTAIRAADLDGSGLTEIIVSVANGFTGGGVLVIYEK
jgi:hypothetical protein